MKTKLITRSTKENRSHIKSVTEINDRIEKN